MKYPRFGVLALVLVSLAASPAVAQVSPGFDLNWERLTPSLQLLTDGDKRIVDQTVELIRGGNHTLALARLSSLNGANPKNSSLRILTAYVQLQLGNLAGAFEEGVKAEHAPDGTSYKCFFLAKIAFLTGNAKACEREIKHVKHTKTFQAEIKEVEQELKKSKKKG